MDAYSELIERCQYSVRKLALSIVHDYQNAEDLCQETFIKAYQELGSLKDQQKFLPWVLMILKHKALDFLRMRRKNVSLETLQSEGFELGLETEVVERTAELHEDELRILAALKELRADYREIIVLKHLENLSYKQIAVRLNLSVTAVGEKLSRVRNLLKQRVDQ
jgi:RNA polymerase sigma factor (sigma-70 family)